MSDVVLLNEAAKRHQGRADLVRRLAERCEVQPPCIGSVLPSEFCDTCAASMHLAELFAIERVAVGPSDDGLVIDLADLPRRKHDVVRMQAWFDDETGGWFAPWIEPSPLGAVLWVVAASRIAAQFAPGVSR